MAKQASTQKRTVKQGYGDEGGSYWDKSYSNLRLQ